MQVARDNALKAWQFPEGEEFQSKEYGSGYPNGIKSTFLLIDRLLFFLFISTFY